MRNLPAQKEAASMADVELSYCTREDVRRELGYADGYQNNRRIDQKIRQAAREIEGWTHRFFYPVTDTRSFDVPDTDTLWLYQHELVSVEAIVSGGTAMSAADYILNPESGPPYGWIDINWSGSVGWQGADTWQRAIAITGDYGYPVTQSLATTLALGCTANDTSIALAASDEVGVGSVILAGTERMVVTDKTLAASGATLGADLTAQKVDSVVTVSDTSLLEAGEVIAVGNERMQVESILTSTTCLVTRAVSGSALAAHVSASVIYAPRIADVARGQLGTVSASHDADSEIYVLRPPSLVTEVNIALACAALEHGSAGYAREVGTGESRRAADNRGLSTLLEDLYTRYGRKTRSRAI